MDVITLTILENALKATIEEIRENVEKGNKVSEEKWEFAFRLIDRIIVLKNL